MDGLSNSQDVNVQKKQRTMIVILDDEEVVGRSVLEGFVDLYPGSIISGDDYHLPDETYVVCEDVRRIVAADGTEGLIYVVVPYDPSYGEQSREAA